MDIFSKKGNERTFRFGRCGIYFKLVGDEKVRGGIDRVNLQVSGIFNLNFDDNENINGNWHHYYAAGHLL